MSKLGCEVIRDLLPSYIEGSCSNNTKELVEEHMLECKACRESLSAAKGREILPRIADENKEFHARKRAKSQYTYRSIITLGCFIGLIAIIIVFTKFNYGVVPLQLYYLLAPICVFTSYYMLSEGTTVVRNSKWKAGMSIVGLALVCYSIILMVLTIRWVKNNSYPFGLSENNLGSFVHNQLLAITMILIAIIIGTIFIAVKTKNSHGILLNISITGSCLAFIFMTMLKRFDSVESFVKVRNNTILILIVEGALMAVLIYGLNKRKMNLKNTLDNR